MIDYTVNIVGLVQIGAIIGGGLLVLVTLKNDVNSLKTGSVMLREDIGSMQAEIKKLGDILINLADIRGEIRVHDTRIVTIEKDVRELRLGLGSVWAKRGIVGEYDGTP